MLFTQMVHCGVLGVEYFQSHVIFPLMFPDKDKLTLFMVFLLICAFKSHGNS